MTSPAPNALRVALGALVALVCAPALFAGLSALATPAGFKTRRAALAADVAQLERLSKRPEGVGDFGPRPVCASRDATQLAVIRQEILAAAGPGGVKLVYLAINPPSDGGAKGPIAPVSLQLRAQGQYDALSGFIDRLAIVQPAIFVDQLDVVTLKEDVVLKLTGKVFCWNSARP